MGSFEDKAKGTANSAAGKIKQGVGKATDDERLRAEGAVQEGKGEAQKAKGKVKDTLKRATDRL